MSTIIVERKQEKISLPFSAGENLLVTGIQDTRYFVDDGVHHGYIDSEKTRFLFLDYGDTGASIRNYSSYIRAGSALNLTGAVYTYSGLLDSVSVMVQKSDGSYVLRKRLIPESNCLQLNDSELRKDLNNAVRSPGSYTITLYAWVSHTFLGNGTLLTDRQYLKVWESALGVGTNVKSRGNTAQRPASSAQSWTLAKGKWHYSRNDTLITGWLKCGDTKYYLTESGALTGWQVIGGRSYCFTNTGALQNGWTPSPEGMCYLKSGEEHLVGTQTVDGRDYIFDANGLVYRNRWRTTEAGRVYYGSDGATLTGWQRLPDGNMYLFRDDGICLATLVTVTKQTGTGKKVKKEKVTYVKSMHPTQPVTATSPNPSP